MKCKFAALATLLLLVVSTSGLAQEDGAALYGKKCAGCHGPGGEGRGTNPALKGTSLDADQIVHRLTKGSPDSKGPHKKAMSGMDEAKAKAIAEFLKNLR